MSKLENFYDKNYKKLLILPALLLLVSLISIAFFYVQNGAIISKDVSLTGGTTVTIFTDANSVELESFLKQKFTDFEIRTLTDNNGKQSSISVIVQEERTDILISSLEEYLQTELTSENSSIETTSASLSSNFAKQLGIAITLAFFWMAGVVFIVFAKGKKFKTITIILNLVLGVLLGALFVKGIFLINLILILAIMFFLIYIYLKNSIPSIAIILSAFGDIVMTLAVVNFFEIQISTAGIVAFLMLIGYSVDTDILLTTRVLLRKKSANQEMFDAFKTGTTMTMTSIAAIAVALFVVSPFGSVLNQIFTILLIGLFFDLINTWITNASIIKWYVETK
jgi:preprotein translocase subunit SecF